MAGREIVVVACLGIGASACATDPELEQEETYGNPWNVVVSCWQSDGSYFGLNHTIDQVWADQIHDSGEPFTLDQLQYNAPFGFTNESNGECVVIHGGPFSSLQYTCWLPDDRKLHFRFSGDHPWETELMCGHEAFVETPGLPEPTLEPLDDCQMFWRQGCADNP